MSSTGLESEGRVAYMVYLSSLRSRWLDIGQVLVLFCVLVDRDGVEVHELANKRTERVVPNGQGSAILPARVANHSEGFAIYIIT